MNSNRSESILPNKSLRFDPSLAESIELIGAASDKGWTREPWRIGLGQYPKLAFRRGGTR
jgi:hypothetical protein